MKGMRTRKREREELKKYERVAAALAACGFIHLYKDKFLEHEMDDDTVQKCINDPQQLDYYLSLIIPKIGQKVNFVSEFKKTKGDELSSSSSKKASTSFPRRIQQPDAFINPNLRKIKMEGDYVPVPAKVKEEPREVENNNDGEPDEVVMKQENHPDLGEDHPKTIDVKHEMANLLNLLKKHGKPMELFQQVLAQENKIHGENHPKTLSTQSAIASLHSNLGNFSNALKLYQYVEKKQIEVLGPEHGNVLITKHNKAYVLFRMDKFQEASKIFKEVHEKQEETLGENHLDTIGTLSLIADSLEKEGKSKEALGRFYKVHEIRKIELGENHPDTIDVKRKIENLEMKVCEENVSL